MRSLVKARTKARIKLLDERLDRSIHFGRNPKNGGNPPNDRRRGKNKNLFLGERLKDLDRVEIFKTLRLKIKDRRIILYDIK